jgi:SAM-dependent methyltransferase
VYLPANRRAKIIELGCSEGTILQWLTEQGYGQVIGVDSDDIAIGMGRNRLSGIIARDGLVCMDMLEYVSSQKDSSVDAVLMLNVLEHIEKPRLLKLLPGIRRILRPEGIFLAQTGNMENPLNLGLFARDFTHHVPFTCNSLRQVMVMCGFEGSMVEVRPVKYKTTIRNLPLQILGPLVGFFLKGVALSMRVRIEETAPLIYCVARKEL